MGNKEILDYVRNTPGNTNPSVLKGLLGNMTEGSSGGLVVHAIEYYPYAFDLDKTWKEIYDALASGVHVTIICPPHYFMSQNENDTMALSVVSAFSVNDGNTTQYEVAVINGGYQEVFVVVDDENGYPSLSKD